MRFVLLISLIVSFQGIAQDITGFWTGTTSQQPNRLFYYDITINKTGKDSYRGQTTIKDTTNGNYGMLEYIATFKDGEFKFQEMRILKEDKTHKDGYWNSMTFFWCIKSGTLTFTEDENNMYLNGPWKSTGTCKPGTIDVFKPKQKETEVVDSGCEDLTSADFLLGAWRGKFKQYSCNINATFPMVVFIDKVDGLKFSGMFIWTDMIYAEDSRSKLEGEIKNGKIYMNEPEILSGSGLVLNGTYESTLTDCDHMVGFWYRDHNDKSVCPGMKAFEKGGDYNLEHYVIPTIYFDHDKATLRSKSKKDLDEFAKFMKDFPSLKFQMSGHTDRTGSNARNIVLSEQRAKIVIDYLVAKGLKAKRFSFAFHAHTEPAKPNDSKENMELNRRTEIQIKK